MMKISHCWFMRTCTPECKLFENLISNKMPYFELPLSKVLTYFILHTNVIISVLKTLKVWKQSHCFVCYWIIQFEARWSVRWHVCLADRTAATSHNKILMFQRMTLFTSPGQMKYIHTDLTQFSSYGPRTTKNGKQWAETWSPRNHQIQWFFTLEVTMNDCMWSLILKLTYSSVYAGMWKNMMQLYHNPHIPWFHPPLGFLLNFMWWSNSAVGK